MRTKRNYSGIGSLAISAVLLSSFSIPLAAQLAAPIPAGQTAVTFINRVMLNPNPPVQVLVVGYFPDFASLPGPLFSGAPSETTAYFTWSLDGSTGVPVANGDASATASTTVILIPSGQSLNVYFNANPNQNWNLPSSFSSGQLIATFRSAQGTQTNTGPVSLVTESYLPWSSRDFVFKGQTYNLVQLLPHGFTFHTLSSNVPLAGAGTVGYPLAFTAGGTGVAIGGQLSALPRWF
jgi:hypothetical protein